MAKPTLMGTMDYLFAQGFPVNRGVSLDAQRAALVHDPAQGVDVYNTPSAVPVQVSQLGGKIKVYPPRPAECDQSAVLQIVGRSLQAGGFELKYDGGEPCFYVLSAPAKYGAESKARVARALSKNKAPKIGVGSLVYSNYYVKGNPLGVGTDTRLIVRETAMKGTRARCERDDGREGSWWIDTEHLHLVGEHSILSKQSSTKPRYTHLLIGRDTTACGAVASAFSTRNSSEVTCPKCKRSSLKGAIRSKQSSGLDLRHQEYVPKRYDAVIYGRSGDYTGRPAHMPCHEQAEASGRTTSFGGMPLSAHRFPIEAEFYLTPAGIKHYLGRDNRQCVWCKKKLVAKKTLTKAVTGKQGTTREKPLVKCPVRGCGREYDPVYYTTGCPRCSSAKAAEARKQASIVKAKRTIYKRRAKQTSTQRRAAQLALALAERKQEVAAWKDGTGGFWKGHNRAEVSRPLNDTKYLHNQDSSRLPKHRLGPAIAKRMRRDLTSPIGYRHEPSQRTPLQTLAAGADRTDPWKTTPFFHIKHGKPGKHIHSIACGIDPKTFQYLCGKK